METETDLTSLSLRSRDENARDERPVVDHPIPLTPRPVRVLLIGAGRVGLVHALTLSRLEGFVLAGIVDPNRKATGLLKSLGLGKHVFAKLDEALNQTRPDASVIATPTASHLELARTCLEHHNAVLIEKPLALHNEQLDDYERLARTFPDKAIQVGYVMMRNPQVSSLIDKLRSGSFGRVLGFLGITLSSLIQKADLKRWEVKKDVAGGGALINAGSHVLSMIHAAFGEPLSVKGQSLKLYSSEVEDSILLDFEYSGFRGRHCCSWSIEGYHRQENRLIVNTEKGQLILTASVGLFISNNGDVDIRHQLDFDVGFNLAPDYAGAGFATQLNDLKESVVNQRAAPMGLAKAMEIERLLFRAYDNCRATKSFEGSSDTASGSGSRPETVKLANADRVIGKSDQDIRRVLDLREVPVEEIKTFLRGPAREPAWSEYLLLPQQILKLRNQRLAEEKLRVTVPDFFRQSRLLSGGQYGMVLREIGIGGVAMATRLALPRLIQERAVGFWVAVMGLVGAALYDLPRRFSGTILLHVYVTDLILTLRTFDILENILERCRRIRPAARVGFHTNILPEAFNALRTMRKPVDEVSALTSPGALNASELFAARRHWNSDGRKLRLTAEVGSAPDIVHKLACDTPEHWAQGADALLIGPGADAVLAKSRCSRMEREWAKAFPGLSVPDNALC